MNALSLVTPRQGPAGPIASVPEIVDELRRGNIVVLVDDEDRENEGQQNQGLLILLKSVTGLTFEGGCFIIVLFFAFWWQRRPLAVYSAVALLLIFAVVELRLPDTYYSLIHGHDGLNLPLIVQLFLFTVARLSIFHLTASDLVEQMDADSVFLFIWVFGTILFAAFVNWSVNGRSLLPMAPALGILIGRMIRRTQSPTQTVSSYRILAPVALSLVLAMSAAWADYRSANVARMEAFEIGRRYERYAGNLWFLGHWGFRYYLEKVGGKALDFTKSDIHKGDIIIIPTNNKSVYTSRLPDNQEGFRSIRISKTPPTGWLSTINQSLGTSFYSDAMGL